MKYLREHRGFTLIELAIVLVIIGIILGAVLRGQDLIQSARSKRFINFAGRNWEVGAWTIFDRNGRFPGDADGDGVIGDGDAATDITNARLTNAPTSPVTLGSFNFFVFLGNDNTGTPANAQNVLVICASNDCVTPYALDQLAFLTAFDSSIDGTSDGTLGQVRGVNAAPTAVNAATQIATYAADPAYADYTAATQALLFYFDRQAN